MPEVPARPAGALPSAGAGGLRRAPAAAAHPRAVGRSRIPSGAAAAGLARVNAALAAVCSCSSWPARRVVALVGSPRAAKPAGRSRPADADVRTARRRSPACPRAVGPSRRPAATIADARRRARPSRSTSGARSPPPASGTVTSRRGAGGTTSGDTLGGCYARLGRDAYQADRAAEAVEHYRQAVDAAPQREHWAGLALAHARAGELARGQSVVEQALRAFPEDPELLYLLADLQERQGRSREAVETLKRLLARESGPRARAGRSWRASSASRGSRPASGARRARTSWSATRAAAASTWAARWSTCWSRAYESLGRDLGVYPEGAGPGGRLRDEDVRRDRRHPAGVRGARARVLRLPEAAAPALGVPGGLDRAGAARAATSTRIS